jgi:hypothetical protein
MILSWKKSSEIWKVRLRSLLVLPMILLQTLEALPMILMHQATAHLCHLCLFACLHLYFTHLPLRLRLPLLLLPKRKNALFAVKQQQLTESVVVIK